MKTAQDNQKRFIYFYFNRYEPEKIREVVPEHVQYWKTANLEGYLGGPFGDRTGGAISFHAASTEEALEVVLRDPFVIADLVAEKWVKEWVLE